MQWHQSFSKGLWGQQNDIRSLPKCDVVSKVH